MNDKPVLRRQTAPDHRPGFWDDLDAALTDPASQTATLPAQGPAAIASEERRRSRSVWPLVAAAAVLAFAGLGLLFARGGDDPGTEVVSGSEAVDVAVADAPPAGEGADADAEGDVPAPIPTAVIEDDVDPETPDGEPADAETGAVAVPIDVDEPAPIDLDSLDVPTYVTAAGNRSTLMFPPATPFADGTRFLGTWEAQQVSWFSLADIEADCTQPDHSTLRYVNADGTDFAVSDPAVQFAGNASNLAVTDRYFAWVAECQGRLVLYTSAHGRLPGQTSDPRIAWMGRGSDTSALVSWTGTTVQLSSVDETGEPFFVQVDMQSQVVSGSGARSDVGPGTGRDSWIVGATPDGSTTWWNATEVTASSCDGSTLARHTEAGGWESPFVNPVDVGAVQTLVVNPALSMVAFSDACPGINEGRFYIGTLRADGLISSVRMIDLSPFATGSVSVLDWTDPVTLRIHTDESVTAGSELRFEYVFDDGRDAGVLVVLD